MLSTQQLHSDGVFTHPQLSPNDGPSAPNTSEVAMEVPGPAVLEQHVGAICGDKIAGKIFELSLIFLYHAALLKYKVNNKT